ncbi:MAG: type II toxin-antitoxin system RelE/ParE family toxin [Methanothrix sp.]|jgi:YafQ family addiction module toxin component|uniref:type II toxin-antitoxin system RelE family toxin n=1 Tax=Methanothrix sp. TaxID=90426 RepID=UPI001BD6C43B|nr:type II toxin-antitoxin system RelE/ParE family toxin [Methanothrix sp.]MBK7386865.1 type II toxin-antitoxin system RelE/ParE family toxin [Methanothrix sp.]HPW73502.1 type II toxin-antitoxin system RelE/ParE family toxin [Methanothrix sp.]
MTEPYDIEIGDKLQRKLKKLQNKDTQYYNAIISKTVQIAEVPQLGKPLRGVLKGKRRVHVGPFVLIYKINENERVVTLIELEHHDDAYRH